MFTYLYWVDSLLKAHGHKYIKRIPYNTPKGRRYRYIYNVTHSHRGKHAMDESHLQVGTAFMVHTESGKEVHAHIKSVSGDRVTYVLDDGPNKGQQVTKTRSEIVAMMNEKHNVSEQVQSKRDTLKQQLQTARENNASEKQIARIQERLTRLGEPAEQKTAESAFTQQEMQDMLDSVGELLHYTPHDEVIIKDDIIDPVREAMETGKFTNARARGKALRVLEDLTINDELPDELSDLADSMKFILLNAQPKKKLTRLGGEPADTQRVIAQRAEVKRDIIAAEKKVSDLWHAVGNRDRRQAEIETTKQRIKTLQDELKQHDDQILADNEGGEFTAKDVKIRRTEQSIRQTTTYTVHIDGASTKFSPKDFNIYVPTIGRKVGEYKVNYHGTRRIFVVEHYKSTRAALNAAKKFLSDVVLAEHYSRPPKTEQNWTEEDETYTAEELAEIAQTSGLFREPAQRVDSQMVARAEKKADSIERKAARLQRAKRDDIDPQMEQFIEDVDAELAELDPAKLDDAGRRARDTIRENAAKTIDHQISIKNTENTRMRTLDYTVTLDPNAETDQAVISDINSEIEGIRQNTMRYLREENQRAKNVRAHMQNLLEDLEITHENAKRARSPQTRDALNRLNAVAQEAIASFISLRENDINALREKAAQYRG